MLILELITSLMLWVSIFLPINSYLLGIDERSPYKLIQRVSNQTIFDVTKIGLEMGMGQGDLCEGGLSEVGMEHFTGSYILSAQYIPVESTSTEATGIVSNGQNIFVSLNSASTTDNDLVVYNYKNIKDALDKVDSGPGIIGLTFTGKNLFAINSSVNSTIQRFKFDPTLGKINKVGDYKIPWSSSANPVYASKISSIYPHLFIGLKKNTAEELLSIDLTKIDLGFGNAIDRKWEFDSSIQALWPIYDKYLHLLVSFAKEPEVNDICLNCDFSPYPTSTTPLSTFDLIGSLGNVRSLIFKDGNIFLGRSAGNDELFKINIKRDYSSTTNSISSLVNLYELDNAIDVDEGVYSMLVSDSKLFLVAGKNNSKIQIRKSDDINNIIQTIETNISISELECIGDKVFGVGSNYTNSGTTTLSIMPIIFELKPVY